jgi:hypothetical protein
MMQHSHIGHGDASALFRHPVRQQRQKQYLKRLNRLTSSEGNDFLLLYDAIATNRPLPETGHFSREVKELATELTDLVREIALTRAHQDTQGYSQLQGYLDDLNIAVNAWKNNICVGRSGFLYGVYRTMQSMARYPICN